MVFRETPDRIFGIYVNSIVRRAELARTRGPMTPSDIREIAETQDLPAVVETVAESDVMRALLLRLDRLSRAPSAGVLLQGEAGVGRRHLASYLHQATFPAGKWLNIDASTAPSYVRGLLRAELPSRGATIFVHEVSRLDQSVQTSVLECSRRTKSSDRVRLVASTSEPLEDAARAGRLLRELIYCFPSVLTVPPLRERRADVAALLSCAASRIAERYRLERVSFAPEAVKVLSNAYFRENIAELNGIVERVTLLAPTRTVHADDLPALSQSREPKFALPRSGLSLAEVEKNMLQQALVRMKNNQTRAAALVGLSRDQFRYRIAKFNLASDDG